MILQAQSDVSLLIPDLPKTAALLPWLQRIDESRHYTNFGPLVRELEGSLAQNWPVIGGAGLAPLQVLTLDTGTATLDLAIAAMELPESAEVLVPAFTFPATACTVLRNRLQVVFADVAADTWQLTPAMAREASKHRRLALVMPVATFGSPLDADAWDSFVEDTGVSVLMDAAAAFGNQAIGRKVHVSFSMHATKPFGVGEGGLLVTRDAELAAKVRRLSDFGFANEQVLVSGTNAKLSEYAAAVGLAQWARWEALQGRRREMWARYRHCLVNLPGLQLQAGFADDAIPANLVVNLPVAADHAARALAHSGIQTRRWYCPPLQLHPAFAHCPVFSSDRALPVTDHLAEQSLGLPWHNFLQDQDFEWISGVLHNVLQA